MQYVVVSTRAGYMVQNVKTYVVVGVYSSSEQAEKVASQLNRK